MKILILSLFSLFIHHALFCQSIEEIYDMVNIPSANAASFKLYGDIPVSFYSGIPQISIPIDQLNSNYLNIPLNLTYHSSGFRPESHPSWVGLGWNLNVGGIITREIKGFPDEVYNTGNIYAIDKRNGLGFYYSYSLLDNSDWYTFKDYNSSASGFPGFTYNQVDRSPDVFSFNFLGYSGKFFLNHKREWKVQCDYPLKVVFDNNDRKATNDLVTGTLPCFTKFTIIDEKGNKYIFGGINAIEYSANICPPSYDYREEWLATSWLLKEIESPNGRKIYFDYERGPFQSNFSYMEKPIYVYKKSGDASKAHNYAYNGAQGSVIAGSVISPVYLTKISIPEHNLQISFETSKSNDLNYFESTYTDRYLNHLIGSYPVPSGFLNFDPTVGIPYFDRNTQDKAKIRPSTFQERFVWLKLDKMKFKYGSNDSKTVNFHYHENPESRLRLNSISIDYPGSEQSEIYGFEYHPNLKYPYNIEYEYLSEYSDHWGYSNKKFLWDKNVLLPKAPAEECAKFGILSKIIYPTKGYTQFIYENHDYSKQIIYDNIFSPRLVSLEDPHSLAGGLRIKEIIDVDGFGNYTTKRYIYERPSGNKTESSGILHSYIMYMLGNNAHLFTSGGLHVRYSHVIEKYKDDSFKAMIFSSEENIQRLEGFSPGIPDDSPVNGKNNTALNSYILHSSRGLERGKLLDEYFCDIKGKVIKSKHYYYTNIGREASNFVRTFDIDFSTRFISYSQTGPPPYTTKFWDTNAAYYYYCYYNKPATIKEITYNDKNTYSYSGSGLSTNNTIIKEQTTEYDVYGQIVSHTIKTSEGRTQKMTIKYPYSDNPTSGILLEMKNKHMMAYPTEAKSYINTTFRQGTAYNYALFDGKIGLFSVEDIHRNNTKSIRYQNTKYFNGRLIERTYNTGLKESYLWDMDGRRVMAIASNMSINQLNAILPNGYTPMGLFSNNYLSDMNTIRQDLPVTAHLKSYDFFTNGLMKQEMAPNAANIHYEYDANERLKVIKDHDNYVMNAYAYNYGDVQNNIFYNQLIEIQESKLCPPGYESDPGQVSFVIPEGVAMSYRSQQEANNNARLKYAEEIQQLAETACNCIRAGEYEFRQMSSASPKCNYSLHSTGIYYKGNNIIANHISLTWETIETDDYAWYNNSSQGIILGQLIGDRYPTTTKTFELVDSRKNKKGETGNIWIISIDSTGIMRIKLKNYDNDIMPKVGENMNFEFIAPIFD